MHRRPESGQSRTNQRTRSAEKWSVMNGFNVGFHFPQTLTLPAMPMAAIRRFLSKTHRHAAPCTTGSNGPNRLAAPTVSKVVATVRKGHKANLPFPHRTKSSPTGPESSLAVNLLIRSRPPLSFNTAISDTARDNGAGLVLSCGLGSGADSAARHAGGPPEDHGGDDDCGAKPDHKIGQKAQIDDACRRDRGDGSA